MVELIAVDGEVIDGGRGVGPVGGETQRVGVAAGGAGLDVMDVVVQDLNVAVGAGDPDADRNIGGTGSGEVADLEPDDLDVALIGDVDEAGLATDGEARAVYDGGLARIALEGDVAPA